MISTGFTLACITSVGIYMVYRKLPRSIRKFMQKHALLTDFVAVLLTYAFLGGTIVALFAAAFMGVITSLMLALANNPKSAALLERMAIKLSQMKEGFVEFVAARVPDEVEKPRLEAVK